MNMSFVGGAIPQGLSSELRLDFSSNGGVGGGLEEIRAKNLDCLSSNFPGGFTIGYDSANEIPVDSKAVTLISNHDIDDTGANSSEIISSVSQQHKTKIRSFAQQLIARKILHN